MRVHVFSALILLAIMILPLTGGITYAAMKSFEPIPSGDQSEPGSITLEKIDRRLLDASIYGKFNLRGALNVEATPPAKALSLASPFKDKARVNIVFVGGDEQLRELASLVDRVIHVWKPGTIGIMSAFVDQGDVELLASKPYVLKVEAQDFILDMVQPAPTGFEARTLPPAAGGEPTGYKAVEYMGAKAVWETYGYTGAGVKVAVVDTGVDLGSSDIEANAIARDDNGVPLIFDADQLGFAVTFNDVQVNGNTITVLPYYAGNYSGVPFFFDGAFYITNSSYMFIYNFRTGSYFYYEWPVTWASFEIPVDQIDTSVPIHFGLVNQIYYFPGGAPLYVDFTAPAIIVDSLDEDQMYDTIYIDLSSVYYMFMMGLYQLGYAAEEPPATLFDYSFADEAPVFYGDETVARDFNGDGINDFSMGTLAGAFYDVYGVFGDTYYFDWLSDWEPGSYVIPGLDSYSGLWFDLVYDWHGHGTSCAHVIGSRGVIPRNLGYIETAIPGVAPGALMGGAIALWNGDVAVAQLWLAGFDMADPSTFTWIYTGQHQADVISNSWGSSYLLINGYASDADPTGLFENFITTASGTVIVHAAGNGGPGWGSVTMPGASSFIITVGASTIFAYRPYYGYVPGGWGQVVSWSDRGPTQFGYPKPDVVNFGSFAWAGARPIDGLGDGVWAYDLFGGTSEATPMTAGAVAIIIQALRDRGFDVDPFIVKTVLKNGADSLGYDAFSQGSGHVNVLKAVELIYKGKVVALSKESSANILSNFDETMATFLGVNLSEVHTIFGWTYDAAVYTEPLLPGQTTTHELILASLGDSDVVSLKPVHHVLDSRKPAVMFLDLEHAYAYIPGEGYVPASEYVVAAGSKLFIDIGKLSFSGSRIMIPVKDGAFNGVFHEITGVIPVEYFDLDPRGDSLTMPMLYYFSLELAVWIDLNEDGVIQRSELSRVQYDFRQGNVFHVQMGPAELAMERALQAVAEYLNVSVDDLRPLARFVVDIRPVYNFWSGVEIPPMPMDLFLDTYKLEEWDWISVPSTVPVPAQTYKEIDVEIHVPAAAEAGIYEGYIMLERGDGTLSYIPVSVPVAKLVKARGSVTLVGSSQPYPYNNYVFKGALDNSWRPEMGDWRTYPLVIDNTGMKAVAVGVEVAWTDIYSEYDAGLIGAGINYWGVADYAFLAYIDAAVLGAKMTFPTYRIARQYRIVFGYFDYPEPGKAAFHAPLDPTREVDVYWLVVHQTIASGHMAEERVVVTLRFNAMPFNTVPVLAGTTATRTLMLGASGMGEAMLYPDYIYVVPMEGQANPPTVTTSTYLGEGAALPISVTVDATSADKGLYLVLEPLEATAWSIILGVGLPQEDGGQLLLYIDTLHTTLAFYVDVK